MNETWQETQEYERERLSDEQARKDEALDRLVHSTQRSFVVTIYQDPEANAFDGDSIAQAIFERGANQGIVEVEVFDHDTICGEES